VLVAAIAATPPTIAVVVSWNQQRAAMHRVESNTNGALFALEQEVKALRQVRRVPGVLTDSSSRPYGQRSGAPPDDDG